MKSMVSTTGLECAAGDDALCRFSVTLSPQRRGFGRGSSQTTGSGDRQRPHPPLSLRPFAESSPTEAAAPGWSPATVNASTRPTRTRPAGPQGAGPAQVRRPVGRPTARPRPGRTGVRLRPPQVPRSRPRARRSRPQQEPDRDPRSGRRDARARLIGAPCQASPRPARDPLA